MGVPARGKLVQLGAQFFSRRSIAGRVGEDRKFGLGFVRTELGDGRFELALRLGGPPGAGERARDEQGNGFGLEVGTLAAQGLEVAQCIGVALALDQCARRAETDLGVLGERPLEAAACASPTPSSAAASRIWFCAVGVSSKAARASRTSRVGSIALAAAETAFIALRWSRELGR
jgi:hypothetical protein